MFYLIYEKCISIQLECSAPKQQYLLQYHNSRDRIVVSTLRCGRSNPGSNPGRGSVDSLYRQW